MNDTMFTELLALVGQAGEGSFVLALIYLLEPYFNSLMVVLAVIATLYVASRILGSNMLLSQIVAELDLDMFQPYLSSEKREIIAQVRRLRSNK